MKKIILLFISISLFAIENIFTQAPQAFKYQTIARDISGNILANQSVSFRISILQDSITGASVYTETQTATTNQFGLTNLNIGMGAIVSGNFSAINWESKNHFVKIEFDPAGGSNFVLMGTSQLLSVPYALFANSAGIIPPVIQTYTASGTWIKPAAGLKYIIVEVVVRLIC